MRLLHILFWFTLSVTVSTVCADTFEEGMALYEDSEIKKAIKIWRPLAEQGDVAAQIQLGDMYLRGIGVKADSKEALKWYHSAALQGNSVAEYNLGNLYSSPRPGMEANLDESIKWYRKSAEHGNANGQFSLATKYFRGEGLSQDNVMSYAWLEVANRNGHHSAHNYRELVSMILSAEEIEKAKLLADQLFKKYSNEAR
jgi:TPR repeat protein